MPSARRSTDSTEARMARRDVLVEYLDPTTTVRLRLQLCLVRHLHDRTVDLTVPDRDRVPEPHRQSPEDHADRPRCLPGSADDLQHRSDRLALLHKGPAMDRNQGSALGRKRWHMDVPALQQPG